MGAIEELGLSKEDIYNEIEKGISSEKGEVLSLEESKIISEIINNDEKKEEVITDDTDSIGVPTEILSEQEMVSLLSALNDDGNLPIELQERLKRECLLSDKINELKRSIKNASDEELDFLSINLDYLIDIMLHNEKIKKEYEYHKTLKKILGINNYEHKD